MNPTPPPKRKGKRKRTAEAIRDLQDPAVQEWFKYISEASRQTYSEHFPPFLHWLRTQPGFEEITPTKLLERQWKINRKKPTMKNPHPEFGIVNMLKAWIASLPDRYKTKLTKWATVVSFFKYNQTPLPKDATFIIRSDRAPVPDRLTYEHIKQMVTAAKLRDKSHMLVRLQGIMDTAALDYVNRHLSDHIVSEMRAGKDIIRLELPGRKRMKNEKGYHTYIGKDAIQCLREYFVERGWPAPGEPIWLNKLRKPYSKSMYAENYLKLLRLQGLVPKPTGRLDSRFGMNLHEWRDQTITYLHTSAKRHNFDVDVAQFISGHTSMLDPNQYDKFMKDKAYTEEQYRIAEPFLNIRTNPEGILRSKVEELDEKLSDIEKKAARGDSRESLIEAVIEARNMVATRWMMGSGSGTRGFTMPPPELRELDEILAVLKNSKSTRLEVYKAQKRFDRLSTGT